MTTPTARLIQGTPEVDTWRQVTDVEELRGYAMLEADLPMLEDGRMFAWMVEMDTKYAVSEAVQAPYARPGTAVARFEMPDSHFEVKEEFGWTDPTLPTDLEVTLPAEGAWTLRVLGGRYDHLVVLQVRG